MTASKKPESPKKGEEGYCFTSTLIDKERRLQVIPCKFVAECKDWYKVQIPGKQMRLVKKDFFFKDEKSAQKKLKELSDEDDHDKRGKTRQAEGRAAGQDQAKEAGSPRGLPEPNPQDAS